MTVGAPHMSPFPNVWSNDIEFSGERKRVRCNEGLDSTNPRGKEQRDGRWKAELLRAEAAM